MAGTQGRSEAAAMLPSLQESLDGDEKELESSEEGGSAEEPSSHYCLYSYRGSRCSARPPLWPRPGPAARPRSPLRVESTVRISIGANNTKEECDILAQKLETIAKRLRR